MHRISLALVGAALLATLVFAGTAAAKPTTARCVTHSQNVIGKKVTGSLVASNVNPVQKRWATCAQAKRAMNKLTAYRYEMPKSVAGYWCTPTVLATSPDVVKYKCLFRAADNPMFVKLTFKVKYNLD